MIKFSNVVEITEIEKGKYNYVSSLRPSIKMNRRLDKIERYMKKMNLMFPYEYLEFTHNPQKHIRTPFIEQILRDRDVILPYEHVKIVTK